MQRQVAVASMEIPYSSVLLWLCSVTVLVRFRIKLQLNELCVTCHSRLRVHQGALLLPSESPADPTM